MMDLQIKKKALFLGYDKSETSLIDFLTAEKYDVFHSKKKTADFFSAHKNFDFNDFHLIISFGYRHIIPKSLIKKSPTILNLHISFLPYNRGSHPVFWSAYETTPSGVSIHIIDEGIDTGPLLYQKQVDIDLKKNTFTEAHKTLRQEIEKLFIDNFNEISSEGYSKISFLHKGNYHNSWDLPKEFVGWDENIYMEIKRLKNNLYFREAIIEDCEDIFQWRNNKITRDMSISSEIVKYNEHVEWFKSTLNDPHEVCLFFKDQLVNLKLGIVRFQLDKKMVTGLISINLSPESRGKNYAKPCLTNAISFLKKNFINCRALYAEIKVDNIPSIKTFEGLDFQLFEEKKVRDNFLMYKLSI